MISQGGGGALLGIRSPHAYVPVPRSMAYNMAKAALDQMARTAAVELIEHRIRVNPKRCTLQFDTSTQFPAFKNLLR